MTALPILTASVILAAGEQLTLFQMVVGIAVAFVAVMVVELISRTLRRFSKRSILARAMVGVPEIHKLKSRTREGAIRELVEVAARMLRWPSEPVILKGVLRREGQMATGLVHGIAVPHARYPKLDRSLVLFARSPVGIEWDCFDGLPARMIFLILTPEEDERIQLQMLAEIGRCADTPACLEILRNARDCRAVTRAIERANRIHTPSGGPE
ncbi:MAG: PTS sugar transporter subunit IIA [bacterium]